LRRREAILRAAERLFSTKAFDGARIREIASAAQIGDTLLYRYFPNKAALAAEVAQRATSALETFVAAANVRFKKGAFGADRLNDFGLAYGHFLEETYYLRCCWHAMPERFAAEDAKIAEAFEALRGLVDSMFARLVSGNREEIRARTLAYLHALEAFVTARARLRGPSDPPLERYVTATTGLLILRPNVGRSTT
jgi:AcrR family transcriptional regulator